MEAKRTGQKLLTLAAVVAVVGVYALYQWSTARAYSTQLLLVSQSETLLRPGDAGELAITHVSGPLELFETAAGRRLDGVRVESPVVHQELKFDPDAGLSRAIGDVQGAADVGFERVECACAFGPCQELQALDLAVEVEQAKLGQPYRRYEHRLRFQVRKGQLMGDRQSVEVAPPGLGVHQIRVRIPPQAGPQARRGRAQQQCVLSVRLALHTRRFPPLGPVREVRRVRRGRPVPLARPTVVRPKGDSVLVGLQSDRVPAAKRQQLFQLRAVIAVLGLLAAVYAVELLVARRARGRVSLAAAE